MKRQNEETFTYYCPLNYQCGCPVQMRLHFFETMCGIYTHEEHTADSHKTNKCTYLSTIQRINLEAATRMKPQERPSTIRRATKNLAEEMRVGPEHARGSANLVRKVRRSIVDAKLKSPHSTGPKATFFHFAQDKCIYKLLSSTHSERGIKFDEVVCLGHQLVDGVFYVGVSSCSMVCNTFRAIASGWDFTYMGDGTFNLCDRKINAITANVNALRNVNSLIAMAFVLQESNDYYAALYKDIVRASFALKKLKRCKREPGQCELCDGLGEIRNELHYKEWLATLIPGQDMMLPVKYTMSDNTGKFHKFVREVIRYALSNVCRGHLSGLARQKKLHLEYFREYSGMSASEWYDGFYDILLQAMNNPYLHLANDLQHMMLDWLNAHGQEVAVAWFHKYWMEDTGVGGRWMICHFGHCGPLNNNGTEGNNGGMKLEVLGASGAKSTIDSRELLANTCTYIVNKSEEQRHELKRTLGISSSLRKMPAIEPFQVEKLKKLHPFVLFLITPVGFEQVWEQEIARFMDFGSTDMSVYDRLCRYQRERDSIAECNMEELWKRITDESAEALDFYFPSDNYMRQLDKKRDMTIRTLRTNIQKDLTHHRLLAEEKLWIEHLDKRDFFDDNLYPDGVSLALTRLDSFHLVRFWPRLTLECNQEMNMFQCFCTGCHKNGVCHHAWALQIIMGRNKSYIIDLEKRGPADDIREDLPKRPGKKDKMAWKQKKAEVEVEKEPAKWKPVSLKQADLPLSKSHMTSEDEMSDGFIDAETEFFQSHGAMTHEQFWLHGDSYHDLNSYIKQLDKERVHFLCPCFIAWNEFLLCSNPTLRNIHIARSHVRTSRMDFRVLCVAASPRMRKGQPL